MKRLISALAFVSVLALSAPGLASEGEHEHHEKEHGKHAAEHATGTVTVQGEIVDMGCYLGHGATGEKHKGCALKCIRGGMPMGLLTGDGTLYLLTMSHGDPDPFEAAKELAAETVRVTGPVHERNEMLSLEVTAIDGPDTGS